ncbi:SRPBCC family protein [Nocardia brasiliensis]|uniref:SRPBCC family protein n=1 Tax=Nocardia brasiliensis TaxID=37326 RepID=UPI001895B64F|nr:SRPBCC family protein [Nocardia brasiliensis]MBF6546458.1 SRPBCC family protein [Nocardia brasiliensis]
MPQNLEAAIDISAPPEQVWSVVADLKRMPEFSPQLVRIVPLGPTKKGTWTLHLNTDGKQYWPTTGRIVRFEPNQVFAFRINENRSIWSYTLEPTATGTRLVERRDMSRGTTWLSRKLIATKLGGEVPFESALVRGMTETLEQMKAAVEAQR